ncbi:MAG: MBOAT family protein, partial [Candidatus Falkowbacteria bacterium]
MCWRAEYIILIIVSTLVDYFAGIKIGETNDVRKKRIYLSLSLCVNLGLLFAFKYLDFFIGNLNIVFENFNIFHDIQYYSLLLPVGISFYTFQTLSYTIDVYRGKIKPERHLGIFALYVSFFPQLVAGPIERAGNLLPQLKNGHRLIPKRIVSGLRLMGWGFFKKVVVADRLAIFVNKI